MSEPTSSRIEPFKAPTGTRDVLPPESDRWQALIAVFASHVGLAGYGLVQSPMFEEIGVFSRVGEGTDLVRKEMYDFHDKGERHIALRPEGTASIARAWIQHAQGEAKPWKVWYAAPSFRYERPQAGRFRQHHQLGAEAIGSEDPDLDVEVIAMLHDFYVSVGLKQVTLLINSMGTADDRRRYIEDVRAWLNERLDTLDPKDAEKVVDHPMRVLDSKRPVTIAAIADAPRITDRLSPEAAERFERVKSGLTALGIDFTLEPRLVRGLDYYTHTTFEFVGEALDAATTVSLNRSAGPLPPVSVLVPASNECCSPAMPRACSPLPPALPMFSWSTPPVAPLLAISPSNFVALALAPSVHSIVAQ